MNKIVNDLSELGMGVENMVGFFWEIALQNALFFKTFTLVLS
jgi:hypothetical protein